MVVVALTAVAYLPVFANGFVDFDDQTNLLENPNFRGLGPAALRWMFTNLDGHYLPLTWLSFAIDYAIWGLAPAGYHLTSLLLHLANALVFYWVSVLLLRLAFAIRAGEEPAPLFTAAAVSAAFFALHPLRVESVAWATERRDVLSGLFFLLTVASYLRCHAPSATAAGRPRWLPLVFYLLSLLAKPVGMSLPLVLMVLDVYPLRRLPADPRAWGARALRGVWIEKLPYLVLGIATAIVEGIAETRLDTFYSLAQYGIGGRVGQAFYALAFYLGKTLVPVRLSPLYQLPVGWTFLRADVVLAATAVLALTVMLVRIRRRWPAAFAAWIVYVALLAPVLGIAQAGPHIAADRYTYLATMGWAVLAGAAVLRAAGMSVRAPEGRRYRVSVAIAIAVALGLAALTARQVGIWHDSIALWTTAVAADDGCYVCRNNLGNALVRLDRDTEARPHFEAARRIQPEDADAYANLGVVAMRAGNAEEARGLFERALRLDPLHAHAHANLARVLIDAGDPESAIPHLHTALRREPMMGEAYTNLGIALMSRGDLDAAERALRRGVEILPDQGLVHNNLATLLLRRSRSAEAAAELRRAITLDRRAPEAWYNLGLALSAQDLDAEAIPALEEALRLRPSYASAHRKLAEIFAGRGEHDQAVAHADAAERIAPTSGDTIMRALASMDAGRSRDAIEVLRALLARDQADVDAAGILAWLLATSPEDELRDGDAAVALAERSVGDGSGVDADHLDTLAAAYAEAGRFDDAVATAERARGLAKDAGEDDLARDIGARLALYQRRRAFRR
jgi:tetratricopeptide (TPR) repeat protein